MTAESSDVDVQTGRERLIGRDLATGEVVRLTVDGERIVDLASATAVESDLVGPNQFLAPGLVDLQINGLLGVDFGDPDLESDRFADAIDALHSIGVTRFLPTLITDSIDRTERALERLTRLRRETDRSNSIPGFHLEGPFISPVDGPRGAHPKKYCVDPDPNVLNRFIRASEGLIKLVTLAPERPGACDLIKRAVDVGIRIAIGHTDADRDAILRAIDAGASMSTHLGNAAHETLHRHRNYVYDQLGDDRLAASLIVDGFHLPPHLVEIFARAKGIERVMLVSDAVRFAGLKPGRYEWGEERVELSSDGAVRLVGTPRLAGAGLLLLENVRRFAAFTGRPFAQAWESASRRPGRYLDADAGDRLGHPARNDWSRSTERASAESGLFEVGGRADLVEIELKADGGVEVIKTMVAGVTTFPKNISSDRPFS